VRCTEFALFLGVPSQDNAVPASCAFGSDDNIMVATTTGHFYIYSLPPPAAGGGACKLESEHSLLDQPSEYSYSRLNIPDDQPQAARIWDQPNGPGAPQSQRPQGSVQEIGNGVGRANGTPQNGVGGQQIKR
jgi:hypothetical protein